MDLGKPISLQSFDQVIVINTKVEGGGEDRQERVGTSNQDNRVVRGKGDRNQEVDEDRQGQVEVPSDHDVVSSGGVCVSLSILQKK